MIRQALRCDYGQREWQKKKMQEPALKEFPLPNLKQFEQQKE